MLTTCSHHGPSGFCWNNKLVRQAANYAIDREGLCKALLNETCMPATGAVYPGHPWFGQPQIVEGAPWIFIVHDLNPRALSPKVTGLVQAQSWYQDLTLPWVEK